MVDRYYGPLVGFEMRLGERGDYVRYSDYAALEAQNAGLLDQVLELENLRDALEAQLAERVKVKALSWSEHPALNRGRKLLAHDCFGNEFARLDLHENQTATSVLMFKAEHEQRYIRLILSALEATPPAPKMSDEMVERAYAGAVSSGACQDTAPGDLERIVLAALTAAQEAGK